MSRNDTEGRLATLDYLHSIIGQLRGMAEAERCDMLAYLPDMASVEAGDVLRNERSRQGGEGRRTSPAHRSRIG